MLNQVDNGEILILPQYPTAVRRIAKIYQEMPHHGVLIVGQPGIGMMFLYHRFMFI